MNKVLEEAFSFQLFRISEWRQAFHGWPAFLQVETRPLGLSQDDSPQSEWLGGTEGRCGLAEGCVL